MDYTPPDRSAAAPAHLTDGDAAANENMASANPPDALEASPLVTWVEWDHLRYRVVALENLLVALLAEGSMGRLDRLREMSRYVAPRRGCTDHPVTLLAAAQIVHLVERARHTKKHASA
ncbi:MAG TPA: hypothetical protein VFW67_13540 [Burkholderiaceae bacterium]|nr:hypothetical protein [Burkholderiaceae bacterium]